MKVSANFDIREFVTRAIWNKYRNNSTWFVQEKVIMLAQFYKDFFTKYYKNKLAGVSHVIIQVNTWHYKANGMQFRGVRPLSYTKGARLSQHRGGAANGFDCDIIIVFNDGSRKEVDYNEIHSIIFEYEKEFMKAGLCAIESTKIAKTWLHSDCRYIPNQKHILVVGI